MKNRPPPVGKRVRCCCLAGLLAFGIGTAPIGDAVARPAQSRIVPPAGGASPCDDFYRHVNQRWLDGTEIPDDRSSWGAFSEIVKRNEAIIERALDEARQGDAPPPGTSRRKLLDFYLSGIDTAAIERDGMAPLRDLFEQIGRLRSRDDLVDILAALHRAGIGAAFAPEAGQDPGDSSAYILALYQGGVGLPDRDFYFNTDPKSRRWRQQYLQHVARMFELIGRAPASARIDAQRVMALETWLARAASTQVERRDPLANYNRMAIGELSQRAPGIDWPRYLAELGIERAGQINVAQPKFMAAFARAAAGVPSGIWQAYLQWHAVASLAPYLPRAVEDENFRFYQTVLEGKRAPRPRSQRVIEAIGGAYGEQPMGQALGAQYAERAFPPAARQRVLALVDDIRRVLRARIAGLDWMGEETRHEALRKLDAMKIKIGYPDVPLDDAALRIDAQGYAANVMRASAFDLQRRIDRLGRPVDRSEWGMGPHIVNAYYDAQMNEIVFPAGILQPPFFDNAADDAANYGAIGSVIGHEIIHGFADAGRHFDAEGNLRDLWGDADSALYRQRTAPIVRQYARFAGVGGLRLNGELTLGENIADIGGLRIAYEAYRSARARQPGRASNEADEARQFFAAYAASWREKIRPQRERLLLTTDPHAPSRFRVLGPLAHMPEFANAFACSAGAAPKGAGIW